MSVEIVMTRESFDCLEKLVPEGYPSAWRRRPCSSTGLARPPHQVVLQLHPRCRGRAARARSAELRAGG
jgi:hypothetical protein